MLEKVISEINSIFFLKISKLFITKNKIENSFSSFSPNLFLRLYRSFVSWSGLVIFLNFDATTDVLKMKAIQSLRANGIKSEFYPDLGVSNKQEKRQWKYVASRAILFVVSKVENDVFTLKNKLTYNFNK